MSGAPDNHVLARQIAVMEERMNTMQADHSATLERFRTDMEKRDKDNTRWQIGLWVATIVVLGILVRWPN